jgi:MFS family permease
MQTSAVRPQPGIQTTTLAAFRHNNFRLYFIGQLISLSGTWMQTVAQGWLVFHLTQSELWLGVVACAAGMPSLVLSPFGGVIVDRVPRRRILLFSQFAQMLLAFTLAWLTFTHVVQVWHIVTLAFLLGVVNAIDAPSRQAIVADMVGRDDLTSGIALNSMMFNASRIFGPAAAGILLRLVGPAWCFFLNGVSFLAVIGMLLIIHIASAVNPTTAFAPLRQLKEGLRFSRRHPTIAPLLLLAAVSSLFVINVTSLLPAFAATVLHSPTEAYATMSTATGVGAVFAAGLMALAGKRFGRGRVVLVMSIFTPLSVFLLSRVTALPLAILLAGLYGFGIILQFVTTNTLIQSEVPDEFRGRVLSLYTLMFFGVAPFGALALGVTAGGFGVASTLAFNLTAHGQLTLTGVWPTLVGIGTPDALALYAVIGVLLNVWIMARAAGVRALR